MEPDPKTLSLPIPTEWMVSDEDSETAIGVEQTYGALGLYLYTRIKTLSILNISESGPTFVQEVINFYLANVASAVVCRKVNS